ncbi:WD40 repeat-containing protein [Heterostelium album PN500]|uniref:WD40 repeat-containing protein n=1 Tax=Heterostelium pallidum (strain ATCC 26659 / Pp 5 / PN500) TaxID=670386 RepID=D3B3C8_HETP5|nr:WD40 repeat-containing protein [Heterostelium album PN500]EFA83826.1 WD40 repeat-containing protein [Heterostelium album PN500]|eukprot:XP_020435943.1 WD40 repeat-containing protein [Heterostelium album PN500]
MYKAPTKKQLPKNKFGFKRPEEQPSTVAEAEQLKKQDSALNIIVQFKSKDNENETTGPPINISQNVSTEQLELLINNLLNNEEQLPYSFFVGESEVVSNLKNHLEGQSEETTINIYYQPQAVFRVTPVTRCSSSLEGHTEAVLHSAFSPDGTGLASVSGDTTLRLWDLNTQTPSFTCKGHTNWVLQVAWSPDGKKIATGGMEGDIRIWNPLTGKQVGSTLKGHTKFITGLAWEPFHLNPKCVRLASSSKDATVKIWDTESNHCLMTLSGHTMSVTCLKWSGESMIYTGSQDRTIRVYNTNEGKLIRVLEGHAHWVNTLALNTDYVLRTGPFDHTGEHQETLEKAQQKALERYNEAKASGAKYGGGDILISGSDDFTVIMWNPSVSKTAISRLTGHQQQINLVSFSPNGRYFASASFDKSIKLWDGQTGKFLGNFRGHVGAVYQVCWSSDSRFLVSGSKDSTLKIWDIKTKKMTLELPGHADEVYTVDWSPNGENVVSGSKDRLLKIWRN